LISKLAVVHACGAVDSYFPAGMQAGESVVVKLNGGGNEQVEQLISDIPGLQVEKEGAGSFRLKVAKGTKPGFYDLWDISPAGIGVPRPFFVGLGRELIESNPNESLATATDVSIDLTINGRMEKPGDIDFFRFSARKGQRVVIECLAERLDSPLRAVLELFDESGKSLATNRGYFGIDPLIDFQVEKDGNYLIRIQDLILSGGPNFIYRLDVDSKPRVAFLYPGVVQRGQSARVTAFGWNLTQNPKDKKQLKSGVLDQIEVEIPAQNTKITDISGLQRQITESPLRRSSFHLPGSGRSVGIETISYPVLLDNNKNHQPENAIQIEAPAEISGRLADADERDYYAIMARAGDVFHFEAFGQRLQSPVDLQLSLFQTNSEQPIEIYNDAINLVDVSVPTGHLDPSGRWVAQRDGQYVLMVQNLAGGLSRDDRRIYRLSVRREEPEFEVVATPVQPSGGIHLERGGRAGLQLVALRRRGFNGPIRIFAESLPAGIELPETWIGPGMTRSFITISAESSTNTAIYDMRLLASAEGISTRVVQPATLRSVPSVPNARLSARWPIALAGESKINLTATASEPFTHPLYGTLEPRHSPGGIVDVAVDLNSGNLQLASVVKLRAIGLPESIGDPISIVPAGEKRGFLSFYLPPNLLLGHYSFLIQAEGTTKNADSKSTTPFSILSNPITIDIQPAAFLVKADPFTVKQARRGETIQIPYQSIRRNGFIGKMHTELAMPGKVTDVTGIRGRGETFVGQTDKGSLQVVINDDAPLGRVTFLRLLTIGVVEDQAIYQGGFFLDLEIVK
jgi:hypothetical protein